MRRDFTVLLAGLVLLAAGCGRTPPPRNVLLVTIDTLRADHLSSYGYERRTSPALDAFLDRGTRFQTALAPAPLTAPSHASIMTGAYPSFHSVGIYNGDYALADTEETLAELCERRGLATAAVVSNPVLGSFVGLDQGFETYDDELESAELNRHLADQIAIDAIDKALETLTEIEDEPFFFWLHLQDPHGPYDPPGLEPWETPSSRPGADRTLRPGTDDVGYGRLPAYQVIEDERRVAAYIDRYDAEILYLDRQLTRLFDHLEATDALDDTLVIVTADHGEAIGEDDFYFAHGHSVGLDQIRVPFGIVGPGVPAGGVTEIPISTIDVFATVLEWLEIDAPKGSASRSLWNTMRDGSDPELSARPVFAESTTQRAVATGNRFLRRNIVDFATQPPPSPGRTDWREVRLPEILTDLAGRPVDESPDSILRTLNDFHLKAERSKAMFANSRIQADLSDRDRERLERLGYTEPAPGSDGNSGSR